MLWSDALLRSDTLLQSDALLSRSSIFLPLAVGQDMPTDYLGYVTRLHKLDTDVRVANERKNLRTNSRSNLTTRGNTTSSNFTFPSNSNPQPPTPNAFSYQPPPLPSQTTTPSLFFPVQTATQTLRTLIELDSSSRPRGPLTEAEKQFRKLIQHYVTQQFKEYLKLLLSPRHLLLQ